jgi:membrane-associated protein
MWLLHPPAMLITPSRLVVGPGTTFRRTPRGVRSLSVHSALIAAGDPTAVNLPGHLGYLALALLVGGESLGLLVPGETAILTAGVLARTGRLDIGVVLPVAAAAAIAGDGIGYLLGRRGVRTLLLIRGPLHEHRARLAERSEVFFARYGAPAVFIGRWVAFARVTVPWLAGASRMPPRTFFSYNVLGGISWSATVALAGYFIGAAAAAIFTAATIVALTVLLALGVRAVRQRRRAPHGGRSGGG